MVIREGSDAGRPIVVSAPESAHALAYRAIAEKLWDKIGDRTADTPRIVIQ
jgi:ATP-binding protein involved in chromosome partitioning